MHPTLPIRLQHLAAQPAHTWTVRLRPDVQFGPSPGFLGSARLRRRRTPCRRDQQSSHADQHYNRCMARFHREMRFFQTWEVFTRKFPNPGSFLKDFSEPWKKRYRTKIRILPLPASLKNFRRERRQRAVSIGGGAETAMPPCRHTANCGFGDATGNGGAMAPRSRKFVSDAG